MDPVSGGAELDQLLGVLLRMLSPGTVPPGSRPAGNDHAAGTVPADTVPAGNGPAGNGPAGIVPDSTAQASSAPGSSAPGGSVPANAAASAVPAGAPAVSASEARALTELLAAHGIAQGQLAALLGLEKSTVSRLAAGLESKGWIRRGRDEQNHRYVRLYLTPQGRAVADRLWQAWQSRQERILAGLTPEERAGLALGLRGVLRGLAAEGLLAAPLPANGQG
jgi:DNA-binding MarR family transcriptional regulator